MKKELIVLITVLMIGSMSNINVSACWAFLSVDELFEKSDIILVGNVIKKNGSSYDSKYSYEVNHWIVEVQYYLKGNKLDEQLIIDTPGENVSIHYALDQWGNNVLLFLYEDEERIQPLSPQGVIPIELSDKIDTSNITSGKKLNKYLDVFSNQDVDVVKVKKRIEEIDVIKEPVILKKEKIGINIRDMILIFTIIIGISILIKFGYKRKRKIG